MELACSTRPGIQIGGPPWGMDVGRRGPPSHRDGVQSPEPRPSIEVCCERRRSRSRLPQREKWVEREMDAG
jgi:hypothetical protein